MWLQAQEENVGGNVKYDIWNKKANQSAVVFRASEMKVLGEAKDNSRSDICPVEEAEDIEHRQRAQHVQISLPFQSPVQRRFLIAFRDRSRSDKRVFDFQPLPTCRHICEGLFGHIQFLSTVRFELDESWIGWGTGLRAQCCSIICTQAQPTVGGLFVTVRRLNALDNIAYRLASMSC